MRKVILFAGAIGVAYLASKALSGKRGNGLFGGVGGSNGSSGGAENNFGHGVGNGFAAQGQGRDGFMDDGGGEVKNGLVGSTGGGNGFSIGVEDEEVIGLRGKEVGNG